MNFFEMLLDQLQKLQEGIPSRVVSVLGLITFLFIAWVASNNRKKIKWKTVAWGIGLQWIFALLVLKTSAGYAVFRWCSGAVNKLISFTADGAGFVWGWLYGSQAHGEGHGMIFFVDILMTIIFFASLMAVLYHIGIMKWLVAGIAKLMRWTMGTSGSETFSASANIFVGQTEAPLVVKPFINKMTMSELHAIMVGGFATVAGGVLAAYVGFGIDAGHLMSASLMSAPAALAMAKMFYPETETSPTSGEVKLELEKTSVNIFDAACVGAGEGMKLVLNVAAMLLAFISLIALLNYGFQEYQLLLFPDSTPLELQKVVGWVFAPLAWLMGVPWEDCANIGELLGIRMVLNEFVSYIEMGGKELSPRAYIIATYAFCGFANFSSIAIQIGGISSIAPNRRQDLAKLGLRAMFAATLASFLTATVAGALLSDEQMERDYYKNQARVTKTVEEKIKHYDTFLEKYPNSQWAEEIRGLKEKVKREAAPAPTPEIKTEGSE